MGINLGGCIALLDGDTSAAGCGARTQASDVCRYGIGLEACGDSPTSEDWDACRAASRIACISYVNDAACTSLPRYARCRYQSFQEYFLGISDIFCGTGSDGTGTGGAGASGSEGGNCRHHRGRGRRDREPLLSRPGLLCCASFRRAEHVEAEGFVSQHLRLWLPPSSGVHHHSDDKSRFTASA